MPVDELPEYNGTFNPDDWPWQRDLKRAITNLNAKNAKIRLWWNYYDGEHPRLWLTDDIAELFKNYDTLLDEPENWIDFAVDAPLKRLRVQGWNADNPTWSAAAEGVFEDNDLELAQTDLYRHMRIAGEAFVFPWFDETKKTGIDLAVNDPRQVFWPEENERTNPDFVVKVWRSYQESCWRATVYYREVCVRLRGPNIKDFDDERPTLPNVKSFNVDTIDDPDNPDIDPRGGEHGFTRVPVVRFSMSSRGVSVVKKFVGIQNRINKLEAYKMVASEFTAFRRLAILTQQSIADGDLSLRPNRALVLDPGGGEGGGAPTSVWEGSETTLSNYDDSINTERDKLFTKATLPSHMAVTEGKVAPSGAEREADEGPFVESIHDMQFQLGACWADVWTLVFGDVKIDPQWANPAIKSDKDEMDTVKAAVEAGMPLRLALKVYAGWSDEMLEELDKLVEEAREEAQAAMVANNTESGVEDESNGTSDEDTSGTVD